MLRIALLALLLAGVPARADDTSRLAAGEILVDVVAYEGSLPGAKVRAVVDAPPERVWRVIDDCGHYKDNLVRLLESEEISREGNAQRAIVKCRTVLDTPWPLSDLTAYTRAVHEATGGTYSRRWKLEQGDFTVNEGAWVIVAFGADGKRALVTYETHAVPKSSVPDAIVERAQKRALPDLMLKLRESVARLATK